MNVAIIAPPWLPVPPPTYGGTELVLDGLCRGLAAAGHDVLLCTTGDSTCPVTRSWTYPRSVGVHLMNPAAEVRHVLAAYDAALEWGADIVHDHTLVGPLYASQHPELPVVTTIHGPFDADLTPLYRRIAGEVGVIAISHHQASTAAGIPLAGVVHHGVDLARYPYGTGDGGYALFLGRMEPGKGVHTAAEVARRAGVPLRIAAKMREASEVDYFESAVQPLLGDGIEYLGEIGGAAKLQLLAEASCLLNPIAWPEPFGMVMIEALACGTPVVTTACGAAPEIVDEGITGFVRDDEASLVEALRQAGGLDRAACRDAVAARFSTQRMAAAHVELYERAVDGHRARSAGAMHPVPGGV
jgi:glycosyltransferase involved in cell wall biosynthesis